MRFDEHFLRGALSKVSIIAGVTAKFPEDARFSIDTRTIEKGDIYVALSGATYDGHNFLQAAIDKGAVGLIIADDKKGFLAKLNQKALDAVLVIIVPDTLQALLRLATTWRAQFNFPVVAITGSVGKTSTKEILAAILDFNGNKYIASRGNQNTQIGLALNMLRMRSSHEMAIFEVGINKRDEMAKLANMLRPTTAVITNVGHCHMEGLGSLGGIAQEKRDLFKYFNEDSIGIINGDIAILASVGYIHPVIKFGAKTTNQIQARKINIGTKTTTFVLKIYKTKHNVTLNTIHEAAVFNSLAATALAHQLGVADEIIIKAIQQPVIVAGRFEERPLKNSKGLLINDCYNANPESMKAALLAFEKIETSAKKIAVLGDMLELGLNGPFWHRQIGRFLRKVPSLQQVILVGDRVAWTKKTVPVGLKTEIVPTWKEAAVLLESLYGADTLVLVKGSRGMELSSLVDAVSDKQPAK